MRLGEVEVAFVKLRVQESGRNQHVIRVRPRDRLLELMRLDLDRHSNPSYVEGGSSPFFRATCNI